MAVDLRLGRGITRLSLRANRDLAVLWQQVSDAATARQALSDILPALIDTYGAAAATLAAEWYDDLRAKSGAPGSFAALPANIADTGSHALIGWALQTASDLPSAQVLVAGGLQRRLSNFSRLTIAESAIADPGADGWQRIGVGANCTFCNMLIGRGAVYSERGADFASHDHCNCQAQPAFRGEPVPVKPFVPSVRTASDADKARVREYLRTH